MHRLVRAAPLFVASLLPTLPATALAQPQATADASLESSLEALVERATRAVVLIDVRTAADSRQGSGFVVDPAGLIVTNYHVMRDARSARVKMASGDVYDRVSILAQDERRDIAVLQVAGFDLPTLPLGNSDSVKVGAPVVLIGSPLGLENTVSTGIVSGRRQEPAGFQLMQVTTPASQGSSGGAIMTSDGRVVGIAVSQLLAGQNLNFAVPINYARGLLGHLGKEPVAVLQPTSGEGMAAETARPMTETEAVNRGLDFSLDSLRGLVIETRVALGNDQTRQTRTTYRVIETVGSEPPRIERYFESETTRTTEPFGTRQTLRRERVRSIVTAQGLRPMSSRGEVEWLTETGWQQSGHEVRFEEDRVIGVVTDSTGNTVELDRTLPRGILLRDVRDLAFGTLAVDSLVGRSVELTTFEPRTGQVVYDRFDVLAQEEVTVGDEVYEALRTNVASGLTNETVYFATARPRFPVRRITQDGGRVEDAIRMERIGGKR